jgi:spoIIIJ-associated protein
MIVKEFEGKNEKEAINKAIEELGLDRDEIDFEIVETKKPGILFRGGKVKIRVHLNEEDADGLDDEDPDEDTIAAPQQTRDPIPQRVRGNPMPTTPFEEKILAFTAGVLERMGFEPKVTIGFREEKKIGIDIETEHSAVLIGKQGKTLEAFQLIVNIAAGRLGGDSTRVILDTQDYRYRREKSLIRMANQTAEEVRRHRESVLLEPMNPFERRLIHTTLGQLGDIATLSEGDGLYKRIRVSLKNSARE